MRSGPLQQHLAGSGHPITRGFRPGTVFGTDAAIGPMVFVDDPDARALGQLLPLHEREGPPGFGVQPLAQEPSIFCAMPDTTTAESPYALGAAIDQRTGGADRGRRTPEGLSMDVREPRGLRGPLDVFVGRFADCIKTAPSRRHLGTYTAGQVGDLERKTAAAVALDAGVPPRSLQEFLAIHRWDDGAVVDRVQTINAGEHPGPDAIGVIDETSLAKKGEKTAGVRR